MIYKIKQEYKTLEIRIVHKIKELKQMVIICRLRVKNIDNPDIENLAISHLDPRLTS